MSRTARSGFTLIELAVAMLIILMLVGLLIVAVQGARARARQGVCLNNMVQVAKSVQEFEATYGKYPGSLNTTNRGWVTTILGNLQRKDLLEAVSAGAPVVNAQIDILVCPSDVAKMTGSAGPAPTSIVGNMGQVDSVPVTSGAADDKNIPSDWQANGIFLNLVPHPDSDKRVKIVKQTASYVLKGDGLNNTIMLSERIGATTWNPSGTSWEDFDETTCGLLFNPATPVPGAASHLHDLGDSISFTSYHKEGSNVVFCSGAAKFISNEITNQVYCQLMTPNGADAKFAGNNTSVPAYVSAPITPGSY